MNPVEVIYGALPALLLFNPSLVRDLLQPLLEFQALPRYPNDYAAPDLGETYFCLDGLPDSCLGDNYPLISGNFVDNHALAVESKFAVINVISLAYTHFPDCGNMLIAVYAHAVKSGDGSLLSRYVCPHFDLWYYFFTDVNSILCYKNGRIF